MDAVIAGFEGWVREHAAWAPSLAFLLALFESLPGIGLLVPATALLLGLGVLVWQGILAPWPVLGAVVLGGVLGDAVGYWLCRWHGRGLVQRWLPRRHRRAYARAVLLFRRWGWAAVFLGRFVGPVRAFAPAIAGVSGMRHRSFQLANCSSALLWAPLMILPGMVIGQLGALLQRPLLLSAIVLAAGLLAGSAWWLRRRRLAGTVALAGRPLH